ncbi:MAG: hypothetical protein M3O78_05745 [Chloroflexota bacterium]|nr:hypothetical protein [Chloroflexota bacterium]
MADDLRHHAFLLPRTTSYNGETIPFAYPPLGFYLVAGLSQVLRLDPVAVIRWVPALLATASVMAFYLMAAEFLRSKWRGLAAASAFALLPRSYLWLIVGGGITRALGMLLALLALQQGLRMLRTDRSYFVATTGMLGGLTLLAHPQAAVFLAISLITVVAFHVSRGNLKGPVIKLATAAAVGVLIASPWLVAVVSAHGFGPLLSAGRTAADPTVGASMALSLSFADVGVLDVLTALGVVGVILRIARRQWLVPTWLLLTILIDPRAGATYATVPLALSTVPVLGKLLAHATPTRHHAHELDSQSFPSMVRAHPGSALFLALLLFVSLRTASRASIDPASPLSGLTQDQASAMVWVATHTGPTTTFAVVTNSTWERDYISEWFPVIAERRSTATVQGSEWTGIEAFVRRLGMYRQLQDCADQTAMCLADWAQRWKSVGLWVFLPKGQLAGPSSPDDCCPALRATLSSSPDYRLAYDAPGGTIFAPAH